MTNETLEKVVLQLSLAWSHVDNATNYAYDDGYSSVVWKLKQVALAIENLETEIQDKEYDDEE